MPHNPQQRIPINTNDSPVSSLSSRRIVLLGKTGVGKSAAGNTILRQSEFRSALRMNAVTRECSRAHATVSGRSVSVVDTPGIFDTEMNSEQFVTQISRTMYLSSPGPHAFLIVFPVNMRFTEQEVQIPQMIEMLFGQEVLKYSIVLFTHGDQLDGESVEELIEESSRLRHLVDQCGGRFHVFNNKDQNNREQVNNLLQKIDSMIEQNGGGYYSNQMFEDAHRFRRDEEERRLGEEEQRQRQEEELRQDEIDIVRRETEQRIRAEYEDHGFLLFLSKYKRHIFIAAIAAGFVVGGAVGGAAVYGVVGGAVGGGVAGAVVGGAETGTVTGAVAGAAVGGAVGAAVGGAVVGGAAAGSVGAVAKAVGVGVIGGAAVGGAAGGASSRTVKGAVKGALAGAVVGGAAVGGAAVGAGLSGAVGGAAVCGAVAGGAAGGAVVGGAVSRNVAGAVVGGAVVGGAVLAGAGLGGAVGGAVYAGECLGRAVAGGTSGEVVRTAGKNVTLVVHCNTKQVRRAHFN